MFLEGVTTVSGVKDLLFMTTTAGAIVAVEALTGTQVWSHQYGPGACQINQTGGACYTTSSPAIDPDRQYVPAPVSMGMSTSTRSRITKS